MTIKNLKPVKNKQTKYKWHHNRQGYKWDKNSPEKIFEFHKNGLIESTGEQLQNIFQEAANSSLEKKIEKDDLSKRNKQKKTKEMV